MFGVLVDVVLTRRALYCVCLVKCLIYLLCGSSRVSLFVQRM